MTRRLQLSLLLLGVAVVSLSGRPVCAWGFGEGADDHDHDHDERSLVTCGSTVQLRHQATGVRLHSHEVSYGSGSGQQSVTGFKSRSDTNNLWVVMGSSNGHCSSGAKLHHGDSVRLQHVGTGKLLHSHLHKSPITNQQEVSCFGEQGQGDTGDNWRIVLPDGAGAVWKRGERVAFVHADTGKYLASNKHTFQNPIPGQQEVCCVQGATADTKWSAEEGLFVMRTDSGSEEEE